MLDREQRALVAASRHAALTNDYMKKFLALTRKNIVGSTGIVLQSQAVAADGSIDQLASDAVEAWWSTFSQAKHVDIKRRRTLRQILGSSVRTAARDGEFFIRLDYGGPMGLQLQTIDPIRCPIEYNADQISGGGFIRQGIEYTRTGEPVAYYFSRSADGTPAIGGNRYQRYPVDEIIHGFLEEFEGQRRGLPWASSSLARLYDLGRFEKSAVGNAIEASKFGGFLEWDAGEGPETDSDDDEDEALIIEAESGVFQELPSGLRHKPVNRQYPAGEFEKFNKASLRGVGAGMGVSYPTLANDLEGVNFSSIRAGVLDERDEWIELQTWLIETVLERIFPIALELALLRGDIKIKGRPVSPSRRSQLLPAFWQGRRWAWVDPQKDIAAEVAAMHACLTTPSEIIRKRGGDPQTTFKQMAADYAAMKEAGIPEAMIVAAISKSVGGNGAASSPRKGEDNEDD